MELVQWRVENIPPRQAEKGGRQRAVQEERKLGLPFSSPWPASGSACLPAKAGCLGASLRVLHTSGTGSGARQGAFRRAGLGLPSGSVLRAAPMLDTLDRSCSVRGDALRLMQTHGRIRRAKPTPHPHSPTLFWPFFLSHPPLPGQTLPRCKLFYPDFS